MLKLFDLTLSHNQKSICKYNKYMEVSKEQVRPGSLMGRIRLLNVDECLFVRLAEYKYTTIKNTVRNLSLDTGRRFRTRLGTMLGDEKGVTITRVK